MFRVCFVVLLAVMMTACSPAQPEVTEAPPPNPTELLEAVVLNIREVANFKMLIEQTGAAYPFYVSLDEGRSYVSAIMRRGEAQFVNPNVMLADITLRVGGLPPIGVDLYAKGLDQWFRLAGSVWINFPIAEGFNPAALVQEDGGFAHALNQLRAIEYMGLARLIDGTDTYHVRGTANGEIINELLFGLLEISEENVAVDVFVTQNTRFPALLTVTIPDTATDKEEDSQWRIEIYDVDGEITFEAPQKVE